MKPQKSAFKGKKKGFIATIRCPCCSKIIEVMKIEDIITPAIKAEKQISYYAEKSGQTELPVPEA
jgi:hypothetical protein